MTFTVDSGWVSIIVGLLVVWGGVVFGLFRWLIVKDYQRMETKFLELENRAKEGMSRYMEFDRQLLLLRTEMLENYIKRDDWIRFASVIDAKIDRIAERNQSTDLMVATLMERK